MYKKHLKLQKLICLLCIVAAAAAFVYSLGMVTDIHDAIYPTLNVKKLTSKVDGGTIYFEIQEFNKLFTNYCLVLLLLGCLMLLTNNHTRRKYYFSNYLSVGLYSVATIAVGIWANGQIKTFATRYMAEIDFEKLKEIPEIYKSPYIDNTNMLDLYSVVLALGILSVVALLGNVIWKVVLMNNEKKLLEAGEEASV